MKHHTHFEALPRQDPEVFQALEDEKKRQMEGIELIPSENLVSQAVLEALGSVGTNKYSEGYPHKRYYGGNEVIDRLEDLAIARLKKLFGAEHANVQPYSGSPANMAVYFALLKPGERFMGMKLTEGGHLTHGHSVNFSGTLYEAHAYGVDRETELLDYDAIARQARRVQPKMLLCGFTAYPREIDFKAFYEIAQEVGAYAFADIAHIAGLVAAGVHPTPFPFFDVVTTTTHKTLRGPRGAAILCRHALAEKIDKAVFPGLQGGPHDHVTAAKAVAFKEALQPSFKAYARQIVKNARALADGLLDAGYRLVSGGTDNHLILVDTLKSGVSGKEAEAVLEKAGIYCNKNTIPFDTRTPWDPSGIRVGTPAITTRGMKESDMAEVARFIDRALQARKDPAALERIRQEVRAFCSAFPFYA